MIGLIASHPRAAVPLSMSPLALSSLPDQADKPVIGFVGLGRLGFHLAVRLIDAGYAVSCCERGRSAELVALGATIPGDGSPAAVSESSAIVITCLPSADALDAVLNGPRGLIAEHRPAPTVVEMSTVPLSMIEKAHRLLVARGGALLNCPISGNPEMAARGAGVIYASGSREVLDIVAPVLKAMSPGTVFVGALGNGTKLKFVANLLVFIHLAAAAEAVAFAGTLGLDQTMAVQILAASPGAASGQFAARAPAMAERHFDAALMTIENTCRQISDIAAAANGAGAQVPLLSCVEQTFERLAAAGRAAEDPAVLSAALLDAAGVAEI